MQNAPHHALVYYCSPLLALMENVIRSQNKSSSKMTLKTAHTLYK